MENSVQPAFAAQTEEEKNRKRRATHNSRGTFFGC